MHLSIESINNAFEAIEDIDFNHTSAYEKAESAFRSIPSLPIFVLDIPKGTQFFRSRTHDSPDLYTSVAEIAAPPKNAVENYGRCNQPHQRRFYCSDNRPTSYIELVSEWAAAKSVGDKVYVSIGRWELQCSMSTVIVPRPNRGKNASAYDQQHGPILEVFLDGIEGEATEALRLFYDFLSQVFRHAGDRKIYIISTAYSNLALKYADVAAIAYPSVPFGEQGLNYGIDASFCEGSNLHLTHVLQNELTVSTNAMNKYSFTETDRRLASRVNMSSGRIDW